MSEYGQKRSSREFCGLIGVLYDRCVLSLDTERSGVATLRLFDGALCFTAGHHALSGFAGDIAWPLLHGTVHKMTMDGPKCYAIEQTVSLASNRYDVSVASGFPRIRQGCVRLRITPCRKELGTEMIRDMDAADAAALAAGLLEVKEQLFRMGLDYDNARTREEGDR